MYQYKDHLGNVRLSYQDGNDNGSVDATEIVEESNYYPFGLKHKGYNFNVSSLGNGVAQRWKFGGKEYQDELDLAWYDVSARNYDPALGRWMNLDPLAEQMRRHSPYNYAFDNPIYFMDPDGMMPCPTGDCPPETRSGNPNDHRPLPSGDTPSASSGSASSSKVSATDAVRSVSAELAYTGIKTAVDRKAHNKKVHTQKLTIKQRDALRVAGQKKEPAITKAFRESSRPASNEPNRPKNNPNKSNAGVNKKAANMGKAGGVFLAVGVVASIDNIANAENKAEAVATETGAWTGAIVGGELLGTAGASLGPYGALGGGIIGSIIGGIAGEEAVNSLLDAQPKGVKNQTRNGYGQKRFESKRDR